MTADMMKEAGIPPNKSKDVLSLATELEWCARELPTLKTIILDPCSSGPKLFREIVASARPSVGLAEDIWHIGKNLRHQFSVKFDSARIPLATPIGARKYDKKYPELDELELDATKVRNHWYTCISDSNGDKEKFGKQWLGLLQHYKEKGTSLGVSIRSPLFEDLERWLNQQLVTADRHVDGYRTDHIESMHHFMTSRYVRKGTPHSDPIYFARRALGAVHWNEAQLSGQPLSKCFEFRKRILAAVHSNSLSK